MNLYNEFSANEMKLMNNIGIVIEDREYRQEELKRYEVDIEDFIMSHSSKNGDISKANTQYNNILNILIRNEEKLKYQESNK